MSSTLLLAGLLVIVALLFGRFLAELVGDGMGPLMDGWQALIAISWCLASIALMVSGIVAGTVWAFLGFLGIAVFFAAFLVKLERLAEADLRKALNPM